MGWGLDGFFGLGRGIFVGGWADSRGVNRVAGGDGAGGEGEEGGDELECAAYDEAYEAER